MEAIEICLESTDFPTGVLLPHRPFCIPSGIYAYKLVEDGFEVGQIEISGEPMDQLAVSYDVSITKVFLVVPPIGQSPKSFELTNSLSSCVV